MLLIVFSTNKIQRDCNFACSIEINAIDRFADILGSNEFLFHLMRKYWMFIGRLTKCALFSKKKLVLCLFYENRTWYANGLTGLTMRYLCPVLRKTWAFSYVPIFFLCLWSMAVKRFHAEKFGTKVVLNCWLNIWEYPQELNNMGIPHAAYTIHHTRYPIHIETIHFVHFSVIHVNINIHITY